ncbi:MAG: DUF1670 domain-containing protein [Limnochordia bacterium]|jgi:hypothetical protein|nr:DUF1670 domain-containing protein [Limnochordia bacterium]
MTKQDVYQPLLQRTVENYQVQHLVRRFDFGKESRIARLIVQEINAAIEQEEANLQIKRVRPFELFVRLNRQGVRLPLFHEDYVSPLYQGETFSASRKMIQETCLKLLQQADGKAKEQDLLRFIDSWALTRRKGPTRFIDELKSTPVRYKDSDSKTWHEIIDSIKPIPPTERLKTPDVSAPKWLLKELAAKIAQETGLGERLSRYIAEEVIMLRNICCPRMETLQPGEMPLLTTHVKAHPSEELSTVYRRHTPIVISVWTPEELRRRPKDVASCLELLKKRIVRVCFEAYRQNGLLSQQQLQWIFQISTTRVSELIRSFQNEHNIVVPTPGTILDAGSSMTHKDIIVRLHLEGYHVSEIAKMTYHTPKSVDNYIGTFEAVLILHLYGIPKQLMAKLLNRGSTLVQEHLNLIAEFYENSAEIREYLQLKGVNF